jgi:hypothetical protein
VIDLNADGALDLVVGSISTYNVYVLLGNGDGSFRAQPAVTAGLGEIVAAVDVNGDRRPDLVMTGGGALTVLIGDGKGGFGPPTEYSIYGDLQQTGAGWLASGDLNGDGAVDLVASVYGDSQGNPAGPGQLVVLLNNGKGTFAKAAIHADRAAVAVAVGDFDGNGKLDAATADFDGTVRIFAGDGTGRLATPHEYAIGGQGAAIVAGDLNGDGHLDLFTGNDASGSVSVLLGNGHGTFDAAVTYPAGNTHSVALADLDGDGHADLLAAGYDETHVNFWRGVGNGTFQETSGIDVGKATARSVATADFNGDGKLDLAVADVGLTLYTFLAK